MRLGPGPPGAQVRRGQLEQSQHVPPAAITIPCAAGRDLLRSQPLQGQAVGHSGGATPRAAALDGAHVSGGGLIELIFAPCWTVLVEIPKISCLPCAAGWSGPGALWKALHGPCDPTRQ